MPRHQIFGQREVQADARYHDKLVTKFINVLMSSGKKSTAERVCYGAFDLVQEKTGGDPLKVFRAAVDNVKPVVEVKSRRVGGASYQVPVEIRPVRRMALALRWLAEYSKARGGKSMREKLAGELLDAANNTGASVKKREDVHRMAEANKAFAHYRW
ncbi:MAG: 30S ribosomal protein S7 [Nitrospirae bacterium RIFCSPLOWO2_02_FULL_62_14]|nr:MAG: 30S ribosomal protein S7 [Nitrospirae bacterium RIFCSPLOWO2_02_FULL_62_14]OGW67329.1 MAG: 30S ribosomal protein S7 [Nitrospirae bacterium RIFCSPLOWO2_01_FULL_62_17]